MSILRCKPFELNQLAFQSKKLFSGLTEISKAQPLKKQQQNTKTSNQIETIVKEKKTCPDIATISAIVKLNKTNAIMLSSNKKKFRLKEIYLTLFILFSFI